MGFAEWVPSSSKTYRLFLIWDLGLNTISKKNQDGISGGWLVCLSEQERGIEQSWWVAAQSILERRLQSIRCLCNTEYLEEELWINLGFLSIDLDRCLSAESENTVLPPDGVFIACYPLHRLQYDCSNWVCGVDVDGGLGMCSSGNVPQALVIAERIKLL